MGILGEMLKVLLDSALSSSSTDGVEPQKKYTYKEMAEYKQRLSGEKWHGVLVSELSKLARETSRGEFVKVDKSGSLVFYYTSKSGKTNYNVQCYVDKNGQLKLMTRGQWHDSADEFVEKANQKFTFK